MALNKWSFFPTEDEKEITFVERETRPVGFFGGLKNTLKSSAIGASLAGAVSGTVGFIFGSMFGAEGAEEIMEEAVKEGGLVLGGGAHFAPGLNAYVKLPVEVAEAMMEANPAVTTGLVNGVNGGVQNMIGGTIGGAAVGAVKGGWADYIIKERELSNNPEIAKHITTYVK